MSKSSRIESIREGLTPSMLGLEVAPWLSPIVPKSEGFNVRTLDVFDRPTLLERAARDRNLVDKDMSVLEEVDFVGSATEIAQLVPRELHGKFDYIVSSHNFEHLPNPIKFLQGCASVLRPGGRLVMVVPDRRACFDYFRPHTQIGDWLDAFVEDRAKPTRRQVFDLASGTARYSDGKEQVSAFRVGVPPSMVASNANVKQAYKVGYVDPPVEDYTDCHCTVMTPASLAKLMAEASQLGLIRLQVESVSGTSGCEFTIRLRHVPDLRPLPNPEFVTLRNRLSREILQEYAVQGGGAANAGVYVRDRLRPLSRSLRALGRRLRGQT